MDEVAHCVDTAVAVAVRLPPSSSSSKAPNRLVCRLPEEVWTGLVVVVAAVPCLGAEEGAVEKEVTGLVV